VYDTIQNYKTYHHHQLSSPDELFLLEVDNDLVLPSPRGKSSNCDTSISISVLVIAFSLLRANRLSSSLSFDSFDCASDPE